MINLPEFTGKRDLFGKSGKSGLFFKSETPRNGEKFGIFRQACLSKVDESEHAGTENNRSEIPSILEQW